MRVLTQLPAPSATSVIVSRHDAVALQPGAARPGGHVVQLTAAPTAYVPVGHGKQAAAPPVEYVLAPHGTGAPAPPTQNEPAVHAVQA